ncbi:MAG: tRNA dihydrouridine synthase [Oligoflexales bacterium]
MSIFQQLNLPQSPKLLAPLAGVSDYPFRVVCADHGADLSYVEMLSATALVHSSQKTFDMLAKHTSEKVLGVQLTSRNADELGEAVAILDRFDFQTIDINMGCPVRKVVRNGGGSAILQDVERVAKTVAAAKKSTLKPVSAKIRLGWDRQSLNYLEVAKAVESEGACWLTVHGRTRSDDYSAAVDLDALAQIKSAVSIPVIGNGNIFSVYDQEAMSKTGVDGFMVSRGALGNPWIFNELKGFDASPTLDEWQQTVLKHIALQEEAYGNRQPPVIVMRKHLLWYLKGWPGGKAVREKMSHVVSFEEASRLICDFSDQLRAQGFEKRLPIHPQGGGRFEWNPMYDMDRKLDRGVGEDCLEVAEA